MPWPKRELIHRIVITTAGYAVTLSSLYYWRLPTSCGEWQCRPNLIASILYCVAALGGGRLAIQPYNYWKGRQRDVSNIRDGDNR